MNIKQTIACREAHINDIDFIYQSLLDMAIEENIADRFYVDKATLQEYLFSDKRLAEVIIAEISTIPVGLVLFSETNRNFTLFKKSGLYVHDIYVLPSYRGQGIASALGETLLACAKTRDYGRIDWVVLNDNALGQAFFASMPEKGTVNYINETVSYVKETVSYIKTMRIKLDDDVTN